MLQRMKQTPLLYLIAAEFGNICSSAVQCARQLTSTMIPRSVTVKPANRVKVGDWRTAALGRSSGGSSICDS